MTNFARLFRQHADEDTRPDGADYQWQLAELIRRIRETEKQPFPENFIYEVKPDGSLRKYRSKKKIPSLWGLHIRQTIINHFYQT